MHLSVLVGLTATLHRNARPAPFLRTLGLVGSALHNRAVYAFFNVFAIVGALACGLVGGGHTNVIFWYFALRRRSIARRSSPCSSLSRFGIVLIARAESDRVPALRRECARPEKEHSKKRSRRSRRRSSQPSDQSERDTWEEQDEPLEEESFTETPQRRTGDERRRTSQPAHLAGVTAPPPTPEAGAKATAAVAPKRRSVVGRILRRSSTKVILDAKAVGQNFKKKLWGHFWAHSIDASSDTHLLQYCLAATVVLMLGTLAGCGNIGASYYQAAEAIEDENRRIAYRCVSSFVYFGFIPLFCAPLFCLWFASLGLGAAVCKSQLRRTTRW